MVRKPENENNDTFLVFPYNMCVSCFCMWGVFGSFLHCTAKTTREGGDPHEVGEMGREAGRSECWEDRGQGKPPAGSYSMSSGFGFFALAVPVDLA